MICASGEIKGLPVNVYDEQGNHLGYIRQNFLIQGWEAVTGHGFAAKHVGWALHPDTARILVHVSRANGSKEVRL